MLKTILLLIFITSLSEARGPGGHLQSFNCRAAIAATASGHSFETHRNLFFLESVIDKKLFSRSQLESNDYLSFKPLVRDLPTQYHSQPSTLQWLSQHLVRLVQNNSHLKQIHIEGLLTPTKPSSTDPLPPSGTRADPLKAKDATQASAYKSENEAADALAKNGYDVHQVRGPSEKSTSSHSNPQVRARQEELGLGNHRSPDLLIRQPIEVLTSEGPVLVQRNEIFDILTPRVIHESPNNVAKTIEKNSYIHESIENKTAGEHPQTFRVVVNLLNQPAYASQRSIDLLQSHLRDNPIENLVQVLVIYGFSREPIVKSIYP